MRTAYLEKFNAFCTLLKERVAAMGADYHKASTAVPHDRTLLDYLAARSHRGRSAPSKAQGGGR